MLKIEMYNLNILIITKEFYNKLKLLLYDQKFKNTYDKLNNVLWFRSNIIRDYDKHIYTYEKLYFCHPYHIHNAIATNNYFIKIKHKSTIYKYIKINFVNFYVLYCFMDEPYDGIGILFKNNTAEIHVVDNYNLTTTICSNRNINSELLKVSIKMLKKFKNKFNINLILIIENWMLKYKDNKLNILLTGYP